MAATSGSANIGGTVFVKFGNIKGTATDANHLAKDGWWRADDLRFGTRRPMAEGGKGTRRTFSVAQMEAVTLTFPYGANAADLWIASTAFEGVPCFIERVGANGEVVLRIELENAMISGFEMQADCSIEIGSGTISFDYSKMSVTTYRYDPSGKLDAKITRSFDVALGRSV